MIDEEALKVSITPADAMELLDSLGIETMIDLKALEAKLMTFEVKFIPSRWMAFDNFLSITKSDWVKIEDIS